ncbi:hypothetical protein BH11ACT3_BH11ACT3_01010 [soil metagenome]
MTATIALDLGQLTSHAQRVAAVGNSFGTPISLASLAGVDVGAFGVLCSRLDYPVQLASEMARETIVEAGNAVARTAVAVHDVSDDFALFEEASQLAIRQLAEMMPSLHTPTGMSPVSSHSVNPLIGQTQDLSTPFTGLGIIEDGDARSRAIASGDWAGELIADASFTLGIAGAVIDPFSTLASMGLSWTLEHMEPLRGWINDLTGDAGQVAGFAQTWHNISGLMTETCDELDASMGQVADMDGETVVAYRRFQEDVVEHVRAAGSWAAAFASGLEVCSAIVQGVHDFVRELFSSLVASVIVWARELAATALLATPIVVEQIALRVATLSGRAARVISRLLRAVEVFINLLDKLSTVFSNLSRVLRTAMKGGTPVTPPHKLVTPKPLTSAEPGRGTGAMFDDALQDDHFGRHGSDFGATTTSEYVRQADEFLTGPPAVGTLEYVRPESGAIVRFNPDTDEFGIVSASGVLETYYRPDPAIHHHPTNLDYFEEAKLGRQNRHGAK